VPRSFAGYADLGSALFPIFTFRTNAGAQLQAWRIPLLRHRFSQRLYRDRIQAVIGLMPHIWSPFVMAVVHAAGARYCTVVHDADAHPGDQTSWVKALIDRSPLSMDVVLT
jgi:hypothetical protein